MTLRHFLCISAALLLSACQTMDAFMEDFSDLTSGELIDLPATTSAAVQANSERLLESPCPQVELVDDLSSISDFSNPAQMVNANLVSRIDLGSAESTCKLSANSAVVDLKLIFNGILGPKGKQKKSDKPFFSYPYFVAVTAPSGKIMAKEIFAASMSYGTSERQHVYFENLRQIIPIRSKETANRYRVLIGFQLSPEQLAYNRANMVPVASANAAKKAKAEASH